MNLEPSENTSIYGYKYFFNEIIQLYNNRKMPNKILLSGKKGSGKSTFAYHLVNFFLSKHEELKYDLIENKINSENKSFKLLHNNSHPNFYYTPGEIIKLVQFAEEKQINLKDHDVSSLISLIIENTYYKKNILIKNLLINFIELFLLKRYKTSNNKNFLLIFYQSFIQKINNTEKFNLDEESLFLEFKSKIL